MKRRDNMAESLRTFVGVYKYFLLIILLDLVILALYPATGRQVFKHTYFNFAEMMSVIPPTFILLGLLDVWVPRETIAYRHLYGIMVPYSHENRGV